MSCMFLAACSGWSRGDMALQACYAATHAIDWKQSRNIAKKPPAADQRIKFDGRRMPDGYSTIQVQDDFRETNPYLAKNSSKKSIDLYFAMTLGLHFIVTDFLKSEATWPIVGKVNPRRIWQATTITIEGGQVGKNFATGVRIDF